MALFSAINRRARTLCLQPSHKVMDLSPRTLGSNSSLLNGVGFGRHVGFQPLGFASLQSSFVQNVGTLEPCVDRQVHFAKQESGNRGDLSCECYGEWWRLHRVSEHNVVWMEMYIWYTYMKNMMAMVAKLRGSRLGWGS